jgi:hypothetical protein
MHVFVVVNKSGRPIFGFCHFKYSVCTQASEI